MKVKLNKKVYFFFQITITCLFVGILCSFLLPSKYYNDATIIVNDPHTEIGFFGAYPFSIFFYHYTLLKHLPYFLISLIQLPLLYYMLYKIGIPTSIKKVNTISFLTYSSFFLIAVFICIPSKEFINFMYLGFIVLLFKKKQYCLKKTIFISFFLFALFSVFFRSYYIFIPILSLAMFLFSFIKSKNKIFNVLLYSLFVAIFMSLSYGLIKGEFISESTREMHNLERFGSSDAQSMIQSPLKTDTWYGESFAIFYGYISVNIPINGFKHILKPQVLAFVFWQLIFFYVLYVRFRYCLQNKNELKYELWVFFFIFSFFIAQSLFEPDLGSAVRHKIGIFPLIYFALYYEKFIKIE